MYTGFLPNVSLTGPAKSEPIPNAIKNSPVAKDSTIPLTPKSLAARVDAEDSIDPAHDTMNPIIVTTQVQRTLQLKVQL